MKKIIGYLISGLCITLVLFALNNYRIDNKIATDCTNLINDTRYEKEIQLENFPIYKQLYSYSCGPTTISMVYSYLEEQKPEKKLLEELNLSNTKKGMLPNTFLRYLRLSLKDYDVALKNNITDTEVLELICEQLERGMPIPIYFSTINDWDKPNYDTHYSAVTGIDLKNDRLVIANAYGFREEVKITDFLNSLKYKNYKNKPIYLTLSTFTGIVKKNNIYIINKKD